MRRDTRDVILGPHLRTAGRDHIAAFRLHEFNAAGIREGFFRGIDDLHDRAMGTRGRQTSQHRLDL
ncbi:MAG: hypothetical protein ABW151_18760 [Pseudorhodoplanes sp.]